MQISTAIFGITLSISVSGCAIHPQPQDFSRVSTFDIEQQIRCETRKAIIDLTLIYVRSPKRDENTRETGDRLAREYEADPEASTRLNPNLFEGEVRRTLSFFWNTGVAYNFKLDMAEVNNADGELDVGSVFGRRAFGIVMKGGLDRSRENTRTFTVTDNFGELVKDLTGCESRIVGPNYAYPITGQIGVIDMIEAFVYMSIFGNLGGETETPATVPKGPPTLVDSLLFTTTVSGTVNPHVAFAPVGKSLGVTAANIDLTASRTDKHQVVVGLALAPASAKQLTSLRQAYFAPSATVGAAPLLAPLLTASPITIAEKIATAAVNQFLTQQLFSPTIILP